VQRLLNGTYPIASLQDVMEKIIDYRGKTPPKTDQGIKLITAKVVKDGQITEGNHEYISEETFDGWMTRGFPKKWDVLITTEAPLGEVAILRTSERIALAQRIVLLRGRPDLVDQMYLMYVLKTEYVQNQLYERSSSTTVLGIRQSELRKVKVPLPPLPEQKRIAAIASKADHLRRTRRYSQQLSDTYLQSVFLEMFEHYLTQSESVPLGSVVTITGGGTPSRDLPKYFTGDIPWLTAKDMRGKYIFDTQEHVTQDAVDRSATKVVPKESILLVVKSKVLMHRLPLAISKVSLCHGQDIKSIQCHKEVDPYFILYTLKYNEPNLLKQARGANTEGLTLPMLREIPVPTVSIKLQQKFAAIVQNFERLRTQQREAERQAEHLFQSILHLAFRGEL
jgi:type I restriction enzyme, S subunit